MPAHCGTVCACSTDFGSDLGEFGFVYANTSSNKEKDVLLLEDGDGDEQ